MKIVNSRGRVLMEVYQARKVTPQERLDMCQGAVMYDYRGPGMGGSQDLNGIHRKIWYITLDNPSAKVVGTLPEPL